MRSNLRKAVDLTSYLFTLPSMPVILLGMLISAIVFGAVINTVSPPEDFLLKSLQDGILLLFIPAILTAMVVKMFIRRMPLRRIVATAFGGELVYGFAYVVAFFVADISEFYGELVLLVGAALVFVLWYVIARLVFILKYRSILFAIIQLLFYSIFLFSFQTFAIAEETLFDWAVKAYVSSFILLGALYIFFLIINAPMKKTFGVSSTDAFSLFISQWIYRKPDLEKAFEKVGENARTLVGVAGFKRAKDKIMFVVPYVHFGPFGNLGGSEFSYLIAEEVKRKYGAETFVFHGTVTHDLNPTSSSEVSRITDAIERILKRSKYESKTVSLKKGKSEECTAETILFGRDAFVGVSRAPFVTEDINFGLGLSMALEAEKHVGKAIVVDQHNAETGEITSFEPGSETGYNYINAVANSFAKKEKQQKLKIGISEKHPESATLGKAGIKIAVLSTSPGYVMVLMDANGITPGFRSKIEKEVKKLGRFEVGIFTTDTHQTNVVRGVLNPAKEESEIIRAIRAGVKEAVSDMKDASAFVDKEWFDIKVLGAKHSIEIVSTVNSIVAVAKITAPLLLVGAILVLLAIISKV
jgi:putative membrane protein